MTMMRTKFQTKKRTQKRFVVGLVDTNRHSIIKGKRRQLLDNSVVRNIDQFLIKSNLKILTSFMSKTTCQALFKPNKDQ